MRKRAVFIILFFINIGVLPAQDWQTTYDQAVSSYQNNQYDEALAIATKAVEMLDESNAEMQEALLYTNQLIYMSAFYLGEFEQALLAARQEMQLAENISGTNSEAYFNGLHHVAEASAFSGDLNTSIVYYQKALSVANQLYDNDSEIALNLQYNYAQVLINANKHTEGIDLLESLIPLFLANEATSEAYIFSHFYLGIAYIAIENYQKALSGLETFMSMLDANDMQDLEEYAEAKKLKLRLGKEVALEDGQLADLLKRAMQAQTSGDITSALEIYSRASLLAKASDNNPKTAFSVFFNQANLFHQVSQPNKAREVLLLAKEKAAMLFDKKDAETLLLDALEARILASVGQSTESEKLYSSIAERSLEHNISVSMNSLKAAIRFFLMKNDAAAWEYSKNAFEHPDYLKSASSAQWEEMLNLFYLTAQANIKSEEGLSILVAYQQKMPDDVQSGYFLLTKGDLLATMGRYDEAKTILQKATDNSSLANNTRFLALLSLAQVQQKLARYAEAETTYRQITTQLEQYLSPQEVMLGQNALATFYMDLGNYEAAEQVLKNLITVYPEEATLLQNLAAVYQLSNKHNEALKLLEKSLAIDANKPGENKSEYAQSLQNLAVVYKQLGMNDQAEKSLTEAIAIDKSNGIINNLSYANKLNNLAMIRQENGELEEAEELLLASLSTKKNQLGTLHPEYAFNLYGLAVLYQRKNEMPLAETYFDQAIHIYMKQIKEVFPILSEKEKTAFYEKIREVVEAYQDFCITYIPKKPELAEALFEFRIATKAILLNAGTATRKRILQSNDEALQKSFKEWIALKEQLAKLYSSVNRNESIIERLETKANDLEKELSRRSAQFANAFEQSEENQLPVLRSKLGDKEAVVEIIRQKLNIKNDSVVYAALIVRKDQSYPQMVLLENGRELENKEFKRYTNMIKYKLDNKASYSAYWEPIEQELPLISRVFISPDGVYNKINLASLYNTEKAAYVVAYMDVNLLTNPASLLKPKSSNKELQAFLLGDPDFRMGEEEEDSEFDYAEVAASVSAERSMEILRGGGVSPLPGTRIEIEKIESLLRGKKWETTVSMRQDASEPVIKQINEPNLLHIATHGFFLGANSQDPFTDKPMLRSGLMLSGVEHYLLENLRNEYNPKDEDGILTAYEAMNLNLSTTELVVLSACETGSGELKSGEGVYGLQRSFLVAGAHSLIMSLWKVDDTATQELMVYFYEKWLENQDVAGSLRLAQLEVMKKYEHPYYWGAFVVTK